VRPTERAMLIADGQLGVITRRQLLRAGLTRHQVASLLDNGTLATIFTGVYRTAGSAASFEQRCLAATYAAGDGAIVSHLASAALRMLVQSPEHIDVTIPECRRVRRPGLVLHHSAVLGPLDMSVCGLVPVTSPPRTLLDITPALDHARLELVVDDALRRGLVRPDKLLAYLARPEFAARPGIVRLRRVAVDRTSSGVPGSHLETQISRLIQSYGFPAPIRQHEARVAGRLVVFDLAYPDERLAIEPEGWAPHWGRDRWQSDHDRYNAIELGGWRVLRFTYADVTGRPAYVAFVIAEKLGLRATGWHKRKK
jgi:very-short-patch-repair endonuclease